MIKFGLSVTGTVNPDAIWTNAGAEVGDALLLTKPLGIGVITTGIKQQAAGEEAMWRCAELDADAEPGGAGRSGGSRPSCLHGCHGIRPDGALIPNAAGVRHDGAG